MADPEITHIAPSELLLPLDGSKLKIIRAEQHLKLLRAKIQRHLKRHTHEIITSDSGQNSATSTRRLTKTIPASISVIVGDCVTNARAAIDYVMWEIAARHFRPVANIGSPEDRRITNFPIFTDPMNRGYLDRLNRFKNRSVPAPIIDAIKAVQPYNAGYEPLWLLHELVNTDKHRMPLLTTAGFGGYMILDTWLLRELESSGGMVKLGTFTVSATDNASSVTIQKGDVEMEPKATIFITWQDVAMPREPVEFTLDKIIKCVANVIPRFEPFLS